jgi:hypothetical protein
MLLFRAALSIGFSLNTFRVATTAAHEIQAEIGLLIATVALVGAGFIEAVRRKEG